MIFCSSFLRLAPGCCSRDHSSRRATHVSHSCVAQLLRPWFLSVEGFLRALIQKDTRVFSAR